MHYIKSKYDCLYRPYMKTECQGYGSGKGQNASTVTNEDTEKTITGVHNSHNNNQ